MEVLTGNEGIGRDEVILHTHLISKLICYILCSLKPVLSSTEVLLPSFLQEERIDGVRETYIPESFVLRPPGVGMEAPER